MYGAFIIVLVVLSNIFLIGDNFWLDQVLMRMDSFTYNFTYLMLGRISTD